jgi:hypothetical protein
MIDEQLIELRESVGDYETKGRQTIKQTKYKASLLSACSTRGHRRSRLQYETVHLTPLDIRARDEFDDGINPVIKIEYGSHACVEFEFTRSTSWCEIRAYMIASVYGGPYCMRSIDEGHLAPRPIDRQRTESLSSQYATAASRVSPASSRAIATCLSGCLSIFLPVS